MRPRATTTEGRLQELLYIFDHPQPQCTGAMCTIGNCECDSNAAYNYITHWLEEIADGSGECQCYACQTRGQGACRER